MRVAKCGAVPGNSDGDSTEQAPEKGSDRSRSYVRAPARLSPPPVKDDVASDTLGKGSRDGCVTDLPSRDSRVRIGEDGHAAGPFRVGAPSSSRAAGTASRASAAAGVPDPTGGLASPGILDLLFALPLLGLATRSRPGYSTARYRLGHY